MSKAIMLLTVCILAIFATVSGNGSKIVGGQVTPIENVPYQVALYRYQQYRSECGGVIINEFAVLTAAHCVRGLYVDDVTFSAGSTLNNRSGSIHRADWIVIHYDYDYTTLKNDIAFVKVVEPFVFSDQIKAASLPVASPLAGTNAVVSGWGERYVDGALLQSVTLPIVSQATCITKYANFDLHPAEDNICAGSTSANLGPCDGDAGGPLVINGTLAGIFIWGNECGSTSYPSVYANVFHFLDFIEENLSYIRP